MSLMAKEAAQAPQAAARFLQCNGEALAALGARLRRDPPSLVITSARGSSDHAAGYFKYLCEILTGVPCASIGASVVSVYGARLTAPRALSLTISQSGQSPDVTALQRAAREGGATAVALVNAPDSPVGRGAEICLDLCAGEERSVAATKSFLVSCLAGAAVIAHWTGDQALLAAVARLPETLAAALRLDWPFLPSLAERATSIYVLGRGPGLPIAQETALKLKETCSLHAEAHSAAEVMHGPLELLEPGFPVIVFAPADAAQAMTRQAVDTLREAGAEPHVVDGRDIPYVPSGHPLLDPVSMMATAYLAVEKTAVKLGRDPDRPRLLRKVTQTR
ncbi:SIS domain-containing protein [Aestuariivirga sp.]|uniref:SIS domain-containing protein n=1 Tax=Aestuariivirga sp. TaxID=2650926 RepID=UPI00391C8484